MEQPEQATFIKRHYVKEAFVAGFASTCGMFVAFAVYNNRRKIAQAIKAIAEAGM